MLSMRTPVRTYTFTTRNDAVAQWGVATLARESSFLCCFNFQLQVDISSAFGLRDCSAGLRGP